MSQNINILNIPAPDKSTTQNVAQCINMYLQPDDANGRYPIVAYPTPGLTTWTTGISPIRALYEHHNTLYAVGGNTVYKIASDGTKTTLGTIGTSSGFAKIRGINQQLLIIDGSAGYVYILSGSYTTTLAQAQNNGDTVIKLTSLSGAIIGSTIAITQSDSSIKTTTISNVNFAASTVTLASGLTVNANNGANVTITQTNIFGQIQDTNFPQNAIDIDTQDEYGMLDNSSSQKWQTSAISDLTTWPGLNFGSVTGNENNLVGIVSLHREIWLCSEDTTELWYNAATGTWPFQRRPDVFLEVGVIAKQSLTVGNNTAYFLGKSRTGGIAIYEMQGYTPVIISTNAITYQLSTYTTVSDAIFFIYKQEHNEFLVCTFPTQNVTWVYDIATKFWHQRQSLVSTVQGRWLANCYAFCYNLGLVGDYNSGNIYKLDMTVFQEGGSVPITRTLTSAPIYALGNWAYCDRLQVDCDTQAASGSALSLYVSRDGGQTFGSAKNTTIAGAGAGTAGQRTYWPRLGQAKAFAFKLTTSMNAQFIVLGAFATLRSGIF